MIYVLSKSLGGFTMKKQTTTGGHTHSKCWQWCLGCLNVDNNAQCKWWAIIITTSRRFNCVFLKWIIPLDVEAWRLSLFLWPSLSVAFESILNNFSFIPLEKGEIFWKETSKRLQKNGTMLQLRDHGRTDLWTYPFVRDMWMIMNRLWSNHHRHFIDLASSQRIFKLKLH